MPRESTSYDTFQSHKFFGVHRTDTGRESCYTFRYAHPTATEVSLVSDFSGWEKGRHMTAREGGIWECTLATQNPLEGMNYKYRVTTHEGVSYEADPYAFRKEAGGEGASVIFTDDGFPWTDKAYLAAAKDGSSKPLHFYEVCLPRWQAGLAEYQSLANALVPHAKAMGVTHLTLLGATSGFAPDPTLGTPSDFLFFVNQCHAGGVGVVLDLTDEKTADTAYSESLLSYYAERCHIDGFVTAFPSRIKEKHPHILLIEAAESESYACDYRFSEKTRVKEEAYFLCDPIHRHACHSILEGFSQTIPLCRKNDTTFMEKSACRYEDKFANNRLYAAFNAIQPRPFVTYMGDELAPFGSYGEKAFVEWYMTDFEMHRRYQLFTKALHCFRLENPSLWQDALSHTVQSCAERNLFATVKEKEDNALLCLFNASGITLADVKIPMPKGQYQTVFSTDDEAFGGCGRVGRSRYRNENGTLTIDIPPLTAVFIRSLP